MIPNGLTGLYFLKNGNVNFYSASIRYNKMSKLYELSEKVGECGVYFKEKKSYFHEYKQLYKKYEIKINKKIEKGYVLDPIDAIEL